MPTISLFFLKIEIQYLLLWYEKLTLPINCFLVALKAFSGNVRKVCAVHVMKGEVRRGRAQCWEGGSRHNRSTPGKRAMLALNPLSPTLPLLVQYGIQSTLDTINLVRHIQGTIAVEVGQKQEKASLF